MKYITRISVVAAFLFYSGLLSLGYAQVDLNVVSDSLQTRFLAIATSGSDLEKEGLSGEIAAMLEEVLQHPESFEFSFDSLSTLGAVYSPDRKLRFYSWNIPYRDGSNRYYGFLQYRGGEGMVPEVYRLTDKSDSLPDPETAVLDQHTWFGCLVYEIVESPGPQSTDYVLLGYDPNTLFTTRKMIDILYFGDEGQPVFGKPVFQQPDGIKKRVLFEYSSRAQMSLNWVPAMNMIVFDHLSPERPSFQGNYQYYGPDFSFDGYVFKNGIWQLMQDIDVRNRP